MIDKFFWGIMNIIGSIIETIIVTLFIGGILILPFAIKGGWLLGIVIYGFIIGIIICIICTEGQDKNNQNKE